LRKSNESPVKFDPYLDLPSKNYTGNQDSRQTGSVTYSRDLITPLSEFRKSTGGSQIAEPLPFEAYKNALKKGSDNNNQ